MYISLTCQLIRYTHAYISIYVYTCIIAVMIYLYILLSRYSSTFSKSSSTSFEFEKCFTSNVGSNSTSACIKRFTDSKYTLKQLVEHFGQHGTFNQSLIVKEPSNVEVEVASMMSNIL